MKTFCRIGLFFSIACLLSLSFSPGSVCAGHDVDFEVAVNTIKMVPYNPRPTATDSSDVTGISEAQTRSNFLATFTRVTFFAPANGKTFASSDPSNHPDITLVGYLRIQRGSSGTPLPNRPGIILSHGSVGGGTSVSTSLLHIANVLFANGYHVLLFDRRDGLLSRCGYTEDPAGSGNFIPDPNKSQAWRVGGSATEDCSNLGTAFRRIQANVNFVANTLFTGRGAFESGDILAAAKFLQDQTGTQQIAAFAGSRGGITVIRSAAMQGSSNTDFSATLLDAILVLSPVADENTVQFIRPVNFSCDVVNEAGFYSGINGSGLRSFTTDPVGAVEDYLELLNGVNVIDKINIPVLIIHTLADTDNFTTINGALAYKSKTDKMDLGEMILLAYLGHSGEEIWSADPYWLNQVALRYFKSLLAKNNSQVGDNPGFPSLGPNVDNPLIVDLKFKDRDAEKFIVRDRMVNYWKGVCAGLP